MDSVINNNKTTKRDQRDGFRESRVIFVEDYGWAFSKDATNKLIEKIHTAGFNVVVPCVWHGRGTHFPSKIAATDSRLGNIITDDYDPLRYFIRRAHKYGIEVHPWFTVLKREWKEYPSYYDNKTPDMAYNAQNKEFRLFISNLILDVVKRYDIDGINLDYIRTMGICKSDVCKESYTKHSGADLDYDLYLRFVKSPARRRIANWQDAAITEIVERISSVARKIKPDLIISVDGHPTPKNKSRPLQGRDEIKWANSGLIDVIYAMDYRRQIDYRNLDKVYDEMNDKDKLIPLISNYDKIGGSAVPRDGNYLDKYIEFLRNKWQPSGVAIYLYGQLSEEQINTLNSNSFAKSVKPMWPQ
jgi:uncharacterized lipoprotein YddW (UPF0748 family)